MKLCNILQINGIDIDEYLKTSEYYKNVESNKNYEYNITGSYSSQSFTFNNKTILGNFDLISNQIIYENLELKLNNLNNNTFSISISESLNSNFKLNISANNFNSQLITNNFESTFTYYNKFKIECNEFIDNTLNNIYKINIDADVISSNILSKLNGEIKCIDFLNNKITSNQLNLLNILIINNCYNNTFNYNNYINLNCNELSNLNNWSYNKNINITANNIFNQFYQYNTYLNLYINNNIINPNLTFNSYTETLNINGISTTYEGLMTYYIQNSYLRKMVYSIYTNANDFTYINLNSDVSFDLINPQIILSSTFNLCNRASLTYSVDENDSDYCYITYTINNLVSQIFHPPINYGSVDGISIDKYTLYLTLERELFSFSFLYASSFTDNMNNVTLNSYTFNYDNNSSINITCHDLSNQALYSIYDMNIKCINLGTNIFSNCDNINIDCMNNYSNSYYSGTNLNLNNKNMSFNDIYKYININISLNNLDLNNNHYCIITNCMITAESIYRNKFEYVENINILCNKYSFNSYTNIRNLNLTINEIRDNNFNNSNIPNSVNSWISERLYTNDISSLSYNNINIPIEIIQNCVNVNINLGNIHDVLLIKNCVNCTFNNNCNSLYTYNKSKYATVIFYNISNLILNKGRTYENVNYAIDCVGSDFESNLLNDWMKSLI